MSLEFPAKPQDLGNERREICTAIALDMPPGILDVHESRDWSGAGKNPEWIRGLDYWLPRGPKLSADATVVLERMQ
jgi:hypothetical protein